MLKQCTSVYNAKDVVNALLLHLLRSVTYARDNMHDYRLIFNYYYYDTLLRRVLSQVNDVISIRRTILSFPFERPTD